MNLAAILAVIEQFAPVILKLADELKLNKLAADLVRKLAVQLVADAKKTATPIDDAIASALSAALGHVADLLDQGLTSDATALLAALKVLGVK